jgi:hypothetical protein
MISRPTEPRTILSLGERGRNERESRTWWDFELRHELNRLADLIYAIRGRIVQEALKMEDENGWQRLEKHLLARLARARLADLHGLGLRDMCECVLNVVYRIGLREEFKD